MNYSVLDYDYEGSVADQYEAMNETMEAVYENQLLRDTTEVE